MDLGSILLFTTNSIAPLILLIVIGYLLKAKGFFTREFLKYGNKTVFYVFLPALLFKNIADIEELSEIRFDVVLYALVVVAILMVVGFLLTFTVSDPRQKGVIHQCVFRSNFALIGVPLSELIGGNEGVRVAALLSLFSIPLYNVISVLVLSVYKGKGVKVNVKKIFKDVITNPLILGVFSGLIFVLIRMGLEGSAVAEAAGRLTFFKTTISYLSKAATPMALVVLGGQFDFKKLSGYRKQLTIGVVTRNVLSPLLGVGLAGLLALKGYVDFGPEVFAALISLFATPVAVASAIMAEAMDNDGQLAGQLVVWTSLLSIISLFVVIALSRGFGLI